MPGVLRKLVPRSSLAVELSWALLLKTAALVLLWWLFFASDSDVSTDGDIIGQHVFGLPMDSTPTLEDSEHGSGNRR